MGHEDINFKINQLCCKFGEPIILSIGPSILDDYVFPIDVAKFPQSRPQCLH